MTIKKLISTQCWRHPPQFVSGKGAAATVEGVINKTITIKIELYSKRPQVVHTLDRKIVSSSLPCTTHESCRSLWPQRELNKLNLHQPGGHLHHCSLALALPVLLLLHGHRRFAIIINLIIDSLQQNSLRAS